MAAALVVPVSGPYTATWWGYILGTQDDNGFQLVGSWQGQEVNASDAYGMTLVEAIYRGLNWRMRFRGLEFNKAGIITSMQIMGSTDTNYLSATLPVTTFTPKLTNIGDKMSTFAKSLVLSAILGNPPTMPQTLTAASSIVAPQSNVEYLMTSKVREAPFEMILLPYQAVVGSLTVNVAFTTT